MNLLISTYSAALHFNQKKGLEKTGENTGQENNDKIIVSSTSSESFGAMTTNSAVILKLDKNRFEVFKVILNSSVLKQVNN